MRRRLPAAGAILASLWFALPARAQQTDTELLKAILCELRELRAAVHQGQVVAPLLDANVREREQTQKRLADLESKLGELDQAVQTATAKQTSAREQLRMLPRPDGSDASKQEIEQRKKELAAYVYVATEALQQHQSEQGRVAAEAARVRGRLAELEGEFDRIEKQVQSLAAASGTVCEAREP